jgi:hypothetical protein
MFCMSHDLFCQNLCKHIISIVWVSKHFSKMLVLSGVFNTIILVATNYANQDYMRVNVYTYSCYTTCIPLVTCSQSKKSCFCLIAPIADWSIHVYCHLLVKHGFYSVKWCSLWNGIRTLKRLMEYREMYRSSNILLVSWHGTFRYKRGTTDDACPTQYFKKGEHVYYFCFHLRIQI